MSLFLLAFACSPPPGPPAAPPTPGPAPSASASASAAAPPAGPLPVVELRWTIDDDLVRSTIGRVQPRPLDPALALPPLPAGLQKSLLGLLDRKGPAGDGLVGARWELGPERKAADLEALVRKLEPLGKGKGPRPAAALLAAGWLVEQRGLAPARGGAWYDRAAGAYAAAAEAAPPGTDLAHHARYRLAMLQWRLDRDDRGKALLTALLDVESELPEAAARLGFLVGWGAGASPEKAAELFRRGLQGHSPLGVGARGALIHGLMLASYRQLQFQAALDEALDFLRGFRGSGPPSVQADGALRVGADSLEFLGFDGALGQAHSPELAEVLLRAAWRSVRREDFALAERVASHVLASSPLDAQAPNALRILIAAADGAGQEVVGDERRARLTRDFGPSSAWATAQRAARGPDGWPGDAVIAAASKILPRTPAEPPAQRVEARARALARLCFEPSSWRLTPKTPFVLAFEGAVDPGGEARVTASTRPEGEPLAVIGRCVEQLGPAHFQKSPASFKASASWDPRGSP